MKSEIFVKLGIITTLLSFIAGTIILLLFLFTSKYNMVEFGAQYLFFAFIINFSVLLALLVKASIENNILKRKRLRKTIWIMLLNIPIAILYFFIVIFV